jgi:hypothetical protein
MDQKRRGRPPGSSKQLETSFALTEPNKPGKKPLEKLPVISCEDPIDGEIEGTSTEKLKYMALQLMATDKALDMEPYRMDIRMKKHEIIKRICHLIEIL